MRWCEGKHTWRWECAQRTAESHCGVPMQIYLDVAEPGEHTVQFSMREDGFAFDQFLLTREIDFRPDGDMKGETIASTVPPDASAVAPPNTSMQFPDEQWKMDTPESQGFDSAKLGLALDYLEGHCKQDGLEQLMIIRNGVCIYQGSQTDKVHNIWSCTKSFASTVLGLLIEEGKCELDTPAADVEPLLKQHYGDVTLRHFATMTSGYSAKGRSRWNDDSEDWSRTPYQPEQPLFAPGKQFAYWDEAMIMFGRVLTRIANENLHDYLKRRVFEPIGMGPVKWQSEGSVNGHSICYGATGIEINARQLARFGHLFLNRGRWQDRQIVPVEWVDAATSVQVSVDIPVANTDRNDSRGSGAYGYNWWINGGLGLMPLAPPKTYYASGFNHNVCFVIPEWNIVIVRMGVDGNPAFGKVNVYNQFIGKLAEAMNRHE